MCVRRIVHKMWERESSKRKRMYTCLWTASKFLCIRELFRKCSESLVEQIYCGCCGYEVCATEKWKQIMYIETKCKYKWRCWVSSVVNRAAKYHGLFRMEVIYDKIMSVKNITHYLCVVIIKLYNFAIKLCFCTFNIFIFFVYF